MPPIAGIKRRLRHLAALGPGAGALDLPIGDFQAEPIDHAHAKIEIGADMHDIEDVAIGPADVAQFLHVRFAHIARRQHQLLGKLQHNVFGLAQIHLSPIIFDLFHCKIVAAFLTQKLYPPDVLYRYYPRLGFAVRFADGKVAELVIAQLSRLESSRQGADRPGLRSN
jgi:hypothetical protein